MRGLAGEGAHRQWLTSRVNPLHVGSFDFAADRLIKAGQEDEDLLAVFIKSYLKSRHILEARRQGVADHPESDNNDEI